MTNTNNNNNKLMYELPTVYGDCDANRDIVLPKNMYQMKPIYDTNTKDMIHLNHPNEQIIESNGFCNEVNGNAVKSEGNLLLDAKHFGDNALAFNPLKDLESRQQLLISRIIDLEKDINSRIGLKTNEQNINQNTKRIKTENYSKTGKQVNQKLSTSSVAVNDKVLKSVKDIVIFSNVNQIPMSVLAVIKSMKSLGLKVLLNIHIHSSLNMNTDSHLDSLKAMLSSINLNLNSNRVNSRLENDLIVTLIFKDITEHQMIVSPLDSSPIIAEVNILRFMARIAGLLKPELSYLYEGINDISRLTLVDTLIDDIHHKLFVNSLTDDKYSEFDSRLTANKYLTGNCPTIADLLLWSGLNQNRCKPKLSPALDKWLANTKDFISNLELIV